MIIHIRKANKNAVLLKFHHITDILWCKARQVVSICFERYYSDGQYWDQFELDLPKGCEKIVVRLIYESVSWEYLKFLAEENKTDDWVKRLYDAWTKTGKCEPTVMAKIEKAVE